MTNALSLLAEPNRMEILRLVWARELSVDDLARQVDVINHDAHAQMAAKLASSAYSPAFRRQMEQALLHPEGPRAH